MINWIFVNQVNRKKRNYWNEKQQALSCRIRFTEKKPHPAGNFRANTIDFLYNRNTSELEKIANELSEQDHLIIEKTFGLSEINQIAEVRELKNNEKHDQFLAAMAIAGLDKGEVIEALQLNEVVATKIKGYYKELFYLKCYLNGLVPQFVLRCCYNLDLEEGVHVIPETYTEDTYRAEILLLLHNIEAS